MVKIEASGEIKRPLEEVFAYLTDPSKLPEWNSLVLEAKTEQPGPVRVGSKIRTVAKFLGRHIDSMAEVTELVPNKKFVQKATSPFPIEITNSVEQMAGGTKVTVQAAIEPGGFFKLAEPVLGRIAKKQMEAQLDTMKELLEAREPAKVGS